MHANLIVYKYEAYSDNHTQLLVDLSKVDVYLFSKVLINKVMLPYLPNICVRFLCIWTVSLYFSFLKYFWHYLLGFRQTQKLRYKRMGDFHQCFLYSPSNFCHTHTSHFNLRIILTSCWRYVLYELECVMYAIELLIIIVDIRDWQEPIYCVLAICNSFG